MKKANNKNRIVSGLLVFAMALGLLIFFGVNAPAQKVYAAENPKATADQVLLGSNTIASYGDNLPAGVSFEDGVLTIGEDYANLGIGVIVQTENYAKADLTIVLSNICCQSPHDHNNFFLNTHGNLTITGDHAKIFIGEIWAEENLTLNGNLIIRAYYNESFKINYGTHGMIYAGNKLTIEDNVDIFAALSGSSSIQAIGVFCAKYIEIDTSLCINLDCVGGDPANNTRHAGIVIHDCQNASILKNRFVIKRGKLTVSKYYEEGSQYNSKYDFIGYSYNGTLQFDDRLWIFEYYQVNIEVNDKYKDLEVLTRDITYDTNGGSGDTMSAYYPIGLIATLPDCTYTAPEGKNFAGWAIGNKDAEIKAPGETFNIENGDDRIYVYAIWKGGPADELTGTVAINGTLKFDETLTAVLSDDNNTGTLSYEWRRNGDTISGAINSTYTLTQADIGYTISVVVSSSEQTGSLVGTAAGPVARAEQNAPTGITATACTTGDNNDGTLTGLSTAMQYKLSTSEVWLDAEATITGLVSGTYNVRYKETETHNAGTSANIVVNAYNATAQYGIAVVNGSANVISAEAGTTVTITADEAPNGYVFDKWTSTDGVIFADKHSAITTFVLPNKAVTVTATYKPTETATTETTPEETGPVDPEPKSGLSAGAVAGIVIASLIVAGAGGFAIFRFVIKKKT